MSNANPDNPATVRVVAANPALFGVVHIVDGVEVTHDADGVAVVSPSVGASLCDWPANPDGSWPFVPADIESEAIIEDVRSNAVMPAAGIESPSYVDAGPLVRFSLCEGDCQGLAGQTITGPLGLPLAFDSAGVAVCGQTVADELKAIYPRAKIKRLTAAEKAEYEAQKAEAADFVEHLPPAVAPPGMSAVARRFSRAALVIAEKTPAAPQAVPPQAAQVTHFDPAAEVAARAEAQANASVTPTPDE